PDFESTPKYCLLEFGRSNKQQVWIVTDGTTFFVDRNLNGDLTEPGEKITDCGLVGYCDPVEIMLDEPKNKTVQMELGLYQREDDPVHHCMKIRIDGQLHQYAGWHEMFSGSPETAKPYNFGGKFTPVPLRSKHLYQDGDQELHLAFATAENEKYAKTLLAYDAVPADIMPVAEIEWPASAAAEPIRTKVFLESRC
ncbi:hypothetical protein N9Y42_09545, partial [Mariniblastus sp.]|nr:hypothetical protein [Mariniblastus sp.]